MISFRAFFLVFLLVWPATASGADFENFSIDAVLDTTQKEIVGSVEYVLPSNQKLNSFEFQLFPNVYNGEDTPYLERYSSLRKRLKLSKNWGSMSIDSIIIGRVDYSKQLKIDYTRGKVERSEPFTGDSVRIYFRTSIPEMGDRLSYNDNDYLLDGWFPKPAILREDGSWYQPLYGFMAELVGQYYNYDVLFEVPEGLLVAASAPPEDEVKLDNGNIRYSYQIGPVHDFALAVSPGYESVEFDREDYKIRFFVHDFEKKAIPRFYHAVESTMEYMEGACGDYPYAVLSFAFCEIGFSGGIEMPGLVAMSSPRNSSMVSNALIHTIVHETVHQWFYGMIGSDQIEDPWLDEAVTEYFASKIMEEYYGTGNSLIDWGGFKASPKDWHRLASDGFDNQYGLDIPVYGFAGGSDYFGVVYARGPLAIETIGNLLGDNSSTFWEDYCSRFRFRYPDTDDFFNTLDDYLDDAGMKLARYMIESTGYFDLGVSGLQNDFSDTASVNISFVLSREGRFEYPVDYMVRLINGDSLTGQWNGEYDKEVIEIKAVRPADYVIIDPRNRFALDANLLNNSARAGEANGPGIRLSSGVMFLVESLLSYLGGM